MTDATGSLPIAGWYPDPDDVAQTRWWNGASWSDDRRPAAASAAPVVPAAPLAPVTQSPYAAAAPYAASAPYAYSAAPPSNGIALGGFIVSLVGLLIGFFGVTGIVGLVLSVMGLQKANGMIASGVAIGHRRGLALAGIVIGGAGAVLTLIGVVINFSGILFN